MSYLKRLYEKNEAKRKKYLENQEKSDFCNDKNCFCEWCAYKKLDLSSDPQSTDSNWPYAED